MKLQRFFACYPILQKAFGVLLICLMAACGSNYNDEATATATAPAPDEHGYEETVAVDEEGQETTEIPRTTSRPNTGEPPILGSSPDIGTEAPKNVADDYTVTLDVTENFKIHETGELRVWIGKKDYVPKPREKMARDQTTVPTRLGSYAKVTPHASNFEVQQLTSPCIKIDPSGSEVKFTLKPKQDGAFSVSATVEIFEESACKGTPVPKSTETLKVIVTVDKKKELEDRQKALFSIFWDKFLSFWGALITIVLGLILFLLRKFLSKKTGYDAKES